MKRQNPLQKATRRIETAGKKHSICLYAATAMALWQHWGKKQEAINRIFELSHVVWNECAKDHDHSMIQMCETEIGIEITNGDGSGWRDVMYLNGTIPESMTEAQILYMRQQQLKWIRPQIMACMMITLHRKYKFGFDRCSKIYQQINDIEIEYRSNPDRLRKACFEMTGIDAAETVTTDRRKCDG